MGPRAFTEERLSAFLGTIKLLEQSEFPYRHSEDALNELECAVEASLRRIRSLSPSAARSVINLRCSNELAQALEYLPLMGFLLRSTNVRNAFEVFRPILRISRKLLGAVGVDPNNVRVLLSSEWDFSPFVYQTIPYLKGYILVGLPATESTNPLVLPLAGHELGHTVWYEGKVGSNLEVGTIDNLLNEVLIRWLEFAVAFPAHASAKPVNTAALSADMFVMDVVQRAYGLAMSQIEETFCDFVGLRILERATFTRLLISSPHAGANIGLLTIRILAFAR